MVGVIYNPFLEETYTAWLGGGAYLNGRRLRVASAKARDNVDPRAQEERFILVWRV